MSMTQYKSMPFGDALSMSKWPPGSVYICDILHYLAYLPAPFPRGQDAKLIDLVYLSHIVVFIHLVTA